MEDIEWFLVQDDNNFMAGFASRKKALFILIYPIISLILYLIVIVHFVNHHSLVYNPSCFMIDDEIPISYKVLNGNFDLYIFEVGSKIDLIYFHGSRINQKTHKFVMSKLKKMGFNLIIPLFPGYGTSQGVSSNEITFMLYANILAGHVRRRENSINVFGRGLGGAVALYFNTLLKCNKIVVENISYSYKYAQFKNISRYALNIISSELWESYKFIKSGSKEADFCNRILFLVCELDEIINVENSYKLQEICNGDLIILEDMKHYEGVYGKQYFENVSDFFNK